MRTRNTALYRALHWPIWIFVFFLAPGPLTFDIFAGRANRWNLLWLAAVLVGTGVAALRGRLPGAEPAPYILRFTEDRPNPLYRRVCYTFGWNAAVNYALMNLLGLVAAVMTGRWAMQPIYSWFYGPVLVVVIALGAAGRLPRVGRSTAGEGTERRYFYGTVWAVTLAQTVLLVLWKALPRSHGTSWPSMSYCFFCWVWRLLRGCFRARGRSCQVSWWWPTRVYDNSTTLPNSLSEELVDSP